MLTAEIVAAESGEVLAGFRETAGGEDDIVVAVDRLSHKLRERIGESLKSIRRSPPLNDVTTGSLEALRKYSQALGAIYTDGEAERGIALLEEALALDTSFAVAYSELGTTLLNRGEQRARALEALGDAYEHRDRLTERERQVVTGNYHLDVTRRASGTRRSQPIARSSTSTRTTPSRSTTSPTCTCSCATLLEPRS